MPGERDTRAIQKSVTAMVIRRLILPSIAVLLLGVLAGCNAAKETKNPENASGKQSSFPSYPHFDGQYTHDDQNEGDDDHDNEPDSEPADRDD